MLRDGGILRGPLMGTAGPPCPIHTRRVTRKSRTRKLWVVGLRVPQLSCASSELGPAPATGLAVGRFCSGRPRGAQGLSAPAPPSTQHQVLRCTVCVLPQKYPAASSSQYISRTFTPLGPCPCGVLSLAYPSTSSLQFS